MREFYEPSTFSQDAPLLHSMLADQGWSARMVYVTVKDAPVWWQGEVVARVSGEFPAAYPSSIELSPVVLLDNGTISSLASWRLISESDTPTPTESPEERAERQARCRAVDGRRRTD